MSRDHGRPDASGTSAALAGDGSGGCLGGGLGPGLGEGLGWGLGDDVGEGITFTSQKCHEPRGHKIVFGVRTSRARSSTTEHVMLRTNTGLQLGGNEGPFVDANIRGFEFQKNSGLLKFSRHHVDWTVFLNDQNCYCQ